MLVISGYCGNLARSIDSIRMSVTPRPLLYDDLDYLGAASGYADEVHEAISKGPIFEHFTHREIEALCPFMHCFAASRGVALLREGDEGDYLLIVLSGKVDVRKQDPKNKSMSIAVAGPGTSLGEMSLIDGERRFASCVTTEPTDFAVMTRFDLNEILVTHPRLANKLLIRLMQIIVCRLREADDQLLSGCFSPVQ